MPILTDIIQKSINKKITTIKELQRLKNFYAKEYGVSAPQNLELISEYKKMVKQGIISLDKSLERLFMKRAIRSTSGIASITVITKKYACPGKCIFCPSEPEMPKSYLSNEPAMMRAILNDFDPYRQVVSRLKGLEKTGHPVDKIEMIVAGGSFNFYPKKYQTDFVREIFNGLNTPHSRVRSLKKAQKINESAKHRCVGLSIETRPDLINEKELIRFRKLGVTKIEIGLQSLDDKILKINKRGHNTATSIRAIQLIKDAGFKINCHMMPNLLGSTPKKDYEQFIKLFDNPAFRPDWLKIYPCVVTPYSELEKIWEKGEYKPYSDKKLADLLVKIKQIIPRYVRLTRMYRDIPAETILAGCKISNIRQILQKEMARKKIKCQCIRCREIREGEYSLEDLKLNKIEFESSGGKEFFLSFDHEKENKLVSMLRLRFPSQIFTEKKHFIPELRGAAIIRELHTYGQHVKVGEHEKGASQHLGLGKKLVQEAENIAQTNGAKKIAIIAGIGVRKYYENIGYHLEGTYMIKKL